MNFVKFLRTPFYIKHLRWTALILKMFHVWDFFIAITTITSYRLVTWWHSSHDSDMEILVLKVELTMTIYNKQSWSQLFVDMSQMTFDLDLSNFFLAAWPNWEVRDPADNYMFKVNNKNTRTWFFIVNFEQVNFGWWLYDSYS